ncbi:MAG: hypothetical protein LRY71_04985 [Bacillaceae bacterium]|nr:hypothetical protein [Bacillaceae bacterium]
MIQLEKGYNPKVPERIMKVIRSAAEVGDTGLPLPVKLKALQPMAVAVQVGLLCQKIECEPLEGSFRFCITLAKSTPS